MKFFVALRVRETQRRTKMLCLCPVWAKSPKTRRTTRARGLAQSEHFYSRLVARWQEMAFVAGFSLIGLETATCLDPEDAAKAEALRPS
jgi:hypothetical protein